MRRWQCEREERIGQSIIADRDTDAPQGHREGIGVRGITGPILTLEGPGAPPTLPDQPD